MSFLCFFKGSVEYRVKIRNPETAVNKLRFGISIRNISISNDILSFSCFYSDRKKVDMIILELGGETQLVRLYGIPYMLSKYRKRAGLFAGALFMFACIFASSLFVWDISVEGNETIADSEIIRELERAGFRVGMLKKSINIETCVNMLLVNEDRLSWAAINFEGTLAHVEVKEAKPGIKQTVKENVNLVANHNGIILRADALDGKAVVEKGEAVTKGQLLVSAFVDKRTGGSLLTGARGYVWAYTERSYSVVVPLRYLERKNTQRSAVKYSFSLLGRTIELPFFGKHSFDMRDETCKEITAGIGDNFKFPLKVKIKKVNEYESYDKSRTASQALELARKEASLRLKKASPDFVLANVVENHTCDDNNLIYTCTFEGVENIAEELEFELS